MDLSLLSDKLQSVEKVDTIQPRKKNGAYAFIVAGYF